MPARRSDRSAGAVLVHSTAVDVHADAVCWGLQQLGIDHLFWAAGAFPAEQSLSMRIDDAGEYGALVVDGAAHDLAGFRSVWNRRTAPPRLHASIDPRDRDYASIPAREHLASVKSVAAPAALWVNRPEAARDDLNKLLQLRIARQAGLAVPATLCSNCPDEIRAFFADQGGRVIFKSYAMGGWTEGGRGGSVLVGYASSVTADALSDDAALRMAPGIFQRRVDRAFEVRATLMGDTVLAARIDPPEDGAAVDWRTTTHAALRVSAIDLPKPIADALRDYARCAGLAFAAFDLIVSPDGEHHFLEANQMGQFLWKEEKDGALPMLDAMCRFLASADDGFRYAGAATPLRFADYLATPRARALLARVTSA